MAETRLVAISIDRVTISDIMRITRMCKLGAIRDLRIHRRFMLIVGFTTWQGRRVRPVHYECDFSYYEGDQWIVEDVKGVCTSTYVVKRALFLQRYPDVDFREVRA